MGPTVNNGARTKGRYAISPFNYSGVRLGECQFERQFRDTKAFYLAIPNDDILKGFYERAGRPSKGRDLGGWYTADIPWRASVRKKPTTLANPFGQWIGAFARMYKVTGDHEILVKLRHLLREWGGTIADDGYFFYGDNPALTHYDFEKMIGGLADAFEYAGEEQALKYAEMITTWAIGNLSRRRIPATPDYPGGGDWTGGEDSDVEWYTLPENLYRLYLLTNETRYRDFAAVWHYDKYWGELAKGNADCMTGLHAYSHVNSLSSAAMAFAVTGESSFLDSLVYGYKLLQEWQAMATGGYGPGEKMANRSGSLANSVQLQKDTFETPCGTWAGFKLARYLMTFTGKAEFGDWIEKLLFNGIGASLPMGRGGKTFYYADYRTIGGEKRYYLEGLVPSKPNTQWTPWPCCSGTYPLAVTEYYNIIYFRDESSLYVNLYVPSQVECSYGTSKLTVIQETGFPNYGQVLLKIRASKPARFALKLRIPGWVRSSVTAEINEKRLTTKWSPGSWGTVDRQWQDGDRVAIDFLPDLYFLPIDKQHPNIVALMYGPVTLVATDRARLRGGDVRPSSLFSRVLHNSLVFRGSGVDRDIEFRPFFAFGEAERYYMYHEIAESSPT